MVHVQRQNDPIAKQMAHDMNFIKSGLDRVFEGVQRNSSDIEQLNTKLNLAEDLILKLQASVNRIEATLRRKNIIIFGIDEDTQEATASLIFKYYGSSQFSSDMIEDAHRVGCGKSPRPIVTKFFRYDVMIDVMKNHNARQNMVKNNIKISADLTPDQQERMKELRQTGQAGVLEELEGGTSKPQTLRPCQRWQC